MINIRSYTVNTLISIIFISSMMIPVYGGEVVSKPYWVYFRDKGHLIQADILGDLDACEKSLLPKARARRAKVMTPRLVDFNDLPVNQQYISKIESICRTKIRHRSRWMNAVSITLSTEKAIEVQSLDYVSRVQPVRTYYRSKDPEPDNEFLPVDDPPHRDYDLDYGTSLRQNQFMNIPSLHDMNFRGRGILIGLLDAGFNNLDHNCFQQIDIVAAYDFINDDDNVGDEDDRGRGDHGTKTLSVVAGYDPGQMIGIAYEASYILGKTENTEWERPIEEDHWVAGMEWMDSLGVEVVSSSLSYSDWYDYEDMDGNTCVTTVVGDRAVAVGIVVVIAMGNQGLNNYPLDKMGAPADGDSLFAIGATNRDSSRAGFSSVGPTWDGRIKPDFVTFGSSVKYASAIHDDIYGGGAGTSFSAPAVAGLCALLIQVNAYLTPMDIRDILRETSDRSENPDTLMGWGIPNALEAYRALQTEEVELVIPLHAGWNTISHNLDAIPGSIQDIFAEIVERDNLILVKDGNGNFYAPEQGFCGIAGWYGFEGYQVGVIEDDELSFEGRLVPYNTPMPMKEDWQIISYLPNFPMIPKHAMQSLVENETLVIVKDEWGRFYTTQFDYSNIPEMQPGRGYHVKMTEDDVLYYPRNRINGNRPSKTPQPVYFPQPKPGKVNMSLLVYSDEGIRDGDEIGCFSSEDRLLGSGVFTNGKTGIAVWCELPVTEPVFRLWKRDQQTCLEPTIEWIQGSGIIIPNEMGVISISDLDKQPDDSEIPGLSIAPNPFNERFSVMFRANASDRLKLTVFDLSGRCVYERRTVAERSENTRWSVSSLNWAGGSYIVQLEINDNRSEVVVRYLK